MKKIVLSLFVAMAACAVMAQDAQKPMILPGAGHINVESLNKKIDLKMDISKLSLSELRVLRNAFAARQGYLFTSSDLRAVFNSTSWYEDLCWKREDENSKMPPIKYSAAETAFINKIKAREDELRKGNLKPASGLVNMDNLINPYQLEEFPTQLRTALSRNGFAIVDNDDEQIFQVYERNDYTMFPNFVTTDLFLQLFHLYFDTMMRKVEEGKLSVVMTDFCQQMYDRMKVRAGYSSNSAAIKDAAEWNQTFFAVGHALITGTSLAAVPEKYKSMAEEELRNSIKAENAYSTYLGYTQVKFPYALFRPRGHYTRSEKSSRYFRAMMWLQSVPFGTDSEDAMYRAAQSGFINATDLADYLVRKGLPFRSAYKLSGQLVSECIQSGCVLETLPLEVYRRYSPLIEDDVYDAIDLQTCVRTRISEGGTSPDSVEKQLAFVRARLR